MSAQPTMEQKRELTRRRARRRLRYATDPEYRERVRAYQRAYHRAKWATDPEYRERRRARVRRNRTSFAFFQMLAAAGEILKYANKQQQTTERKNA